MGKKTAKKKSKSSHKDNKKVSSDSPKSDLTSTDNVVVKDSRICPHIVNGIQLDVLKEKFESSVSLKCEDCRGDVGDKRSNKKQNKKGGAESKSIWVCLYCGQFSCGSVGLPTAPQFHAIRHSKARRHQLTVQLVNPQRLWCFACSTLVHPEKTEGDAEESDVLHKIAKMIKERPAEVTGADVEEVWFGGRGSGSVLDGVTRGSCPADRSDGNFRDPVRGMTNLGNTCFFNSVMQSLLALKHLRHYFLELDVPPGPLTSSLKKLVVEVCEESGPRSSISPKALFGSVCSKAPQFRGYQQQDSHEFLRYLLDGLSTEELTAKKRIEPPQEDGKSEPTFVEAMFGGQLCNVITCMECGYSSIVHEPLLDLSISLPSKKSPPRKALPVYGPKKPKLPLPPKKKKGRNYTRLNKNSSDPSSCRSADKSVRGNVSSDNHTTMSNAENHEPKLCNENNNKEQALPEVDDTVSSTNAVDSTILNVENSEPKHCNENNIKEQDLPEDYWLDYIVSGIDTVDSDFPDLPLTQEHAAEEADQNDMVVHDSTECGGLKNEVCTDNAKSLHMLASMDDDVGERLPDLHDLTSQVNEKLVLRDPSEDSAKDNNKTSEKTSSDAVKLSDGSSKEATPPIFEDSAINSFIEGKDSTTSLGYEEGLVEYDLGGLFDEPEVAVTVGNSFEAIKTVEFVSESEPEEVDNSDETLTVERCLSLFTKSEVLPEKENAWQCERCSKLLQETMRREKKLQKSSSHSMLNENEGGQMASGQVDFQQTGIPSNWESHLSNGDINMESVNNVDVDCILKTSEQSGMDLGATQCDETKGDMDENTEQVNGDYRRHEDLNVDKPDASNQGVDILSANVESEARDDEKEDSATVKVTRDATKRILIDKAPRVLTIHLKRFGDDARGRLIKLNGHVKFSTTLDLMPYINPSSPEKDECCKYRLVGVVEHSGSLRGGHYIAYVRGGKSMKSNAADDNDYVWYLANDSKVRQSSLDEVLRSDAYILFYERV